MVASSPTCDLRRLQRLLRSELSEAEESVTTDHVEGCTHCRTQLEAFAADSGWWQETGRQLRTSQWQRDGTLRLSLDDAASVISYSPGSASGQGGGDTWITSLDFLEPTDNPAMLGRLGDHEILEVIGAGGFGVVLKGYDRELNRYVAIKVLAPHLAHSAAARKRFGREAKAAAAVVHPHVVAIHAVVSGSKLPYLVMPFVAGESLQQRLDRQGPLEVTEILRIGMQTALGLAAAHAQGLVHRDIKPGNILLEHAVDRVLLTDFGLARTMDDAGLTRSTVIAGTPQYMSPEQARGETVDHRSDLFSLGSVVYAMCTGHPPFRGETLIGVLRRIADSAPHEVRETNPDIPPWLVAILRKLHEPHPDRRFQSAAEIAGLMEQCLAHVQQPMAVRLPRVPVSPAQAASRRRVGILTGIAAIATIVGLTFLAFELLSAFKNHDESAASPRAAASTSGDEEKRAPRPESSVPIEWNDSVARELAEIEYRLQVLESISRP